MRLMDAVVVGGGVAGSATALALRRIGVPVTIVEAYPDPAGSVGSFVSLAANGLRALDRLDCLDRVRARGFAVPRQRLWAGSGALLGDVARCRRPDDPRPSITLWRADLVDEFRRAAVETGATLLTGDAVTRIAPDHPPTAYVETAGGLTLEAGLVVGADGIWSRSRELLNPGGPAPAYAGVFVASGRSRGVELEPGVFNLVFGRSGAFIAVARPDGEIWWQAQVSRAEPPPSTVKPVAELFPERLPAAVLATTTEVHRTTLNYWLPSVPVWSRGPLVLVGDAIHPVGAGQGASLAIEDAVVLAHSLDQQPTRPAALAAYEAARRPRIARMLKASDDNRATKRAGPARRALERVMMPFVLRHFYDRATAWLYAYEPPTVACGQTQ
jgi:salicylate hydroxylase